MALTKFKLVEITEHVCSSMASKQEVYDLEIADDHSYNIEGTIVHNSACSTRIKTGVGYPQFSAVLECADAAHGLGGLIVSDGGITCPGDVAKAFGAGADFVMAGGYFAGCDEGGGEKIYKDGAPSCVQFYGMSSKTAQDKHGNGLAEYRASEGRVVTVPYKGSVETVIKDLLGGIRSTCTYVGAKSLKELSKRATFCKVSQQISTPYGVGELNK